MTSILQTPNMWRYPQTFCGAKDNAGWRLQSMTTTERDALSAAGSRFAPGIGDIIFNTTAGSVQAWNGSSWGDIPSLPPAATVGTVTTGATTVATEYGNAIDHMTLLTMTGFAIGTSGDNASLAIGAKFYTWPTGKNIMVEWASIAGGVTAAISVTTNTPEVGIGTVIASGANATLTTGTWENLVDGGASGSSVDAASVAPDVAGTAFYKKSLTTVTPIIKASGGAARDLFLNAAAAWADVAAAGAVTFTGTIVLKWTILS